MNISESAEVYSEPSQKPKVESFFSFQKLAQISGNCNKFPKERIKTSVASEMFKTENHSKIPQVADATDGTRHIRKQGLKILNRTLSLRTLKRPNRRLTSRSRLKWKRQGSIGSMGWGKSRF